MITLKSLENPRESNSAGTLIDMDVTTAEYGVTPCTFHAGDAVKYIFDGKEITNGELFGLAARGAFGVVKPFGS